MVTVWPDKNGGREDTLNANPLSFKSTRAAVMLPEAVVSLSVVMTSFAGTGAMVAENAPVPLTLGKVNGKLMVAEPPAVMAGNVTETKFAALSNRFTRSFAPGV